MIPRGHSKFIPQLCLVRRKELTHLHVCVVRCVDTAWKSNRALSEPLQRHPIETRVGVLGSLGSLGSLLNLISAIPSPSFVWDKTSEPCAT